MLYKTYHWRTLRSSLLDNHILSCYSDRMPVDRDRTMPNSGNNKLLIYHISCPWSRQISSVGTFLPSLYWTNSTKKYYKWLQFHKINIIILFIRGRRERQYLDIFHKLGYFRRVYSIHIKVSRQRIALWALYIGI